MEHTIRILHLEDSLRDADLVAAELDSAGLNDEITHVQGRAEYLAALEQQVFDVIICDYNIPGYDGLTGLQHAIEKQPEVPVVMVSGSIDEGEAVRCLHAGAADYIFKDRLQRLGHAVLHALKEAEAARERREADLARREVEERFTRFAEQSDEVFWFMNADPEQVRYLSPAFEKAWGIPVEQVYENPRKWTESVHPEDRERVVGAIEAFLTVRTPEFSEEYRVVRPDGTVRDVADCRTLTRDDNGKPVSASGIARDITKTKHLQEQFRQSQKMEAIGRLAGGVAHDFNNLLTVINGHCDLILQQLDPRDPMHEEVAEIRKAGQRAAELTRNLLIFSRKQVIRPKVLNLNRVVEDMEKLLGRLIGEDIDLKMLLDAQLGRVLADPGQLGQVLMNLAVNSRDAMPNGGHLTIGTANVELGVTYLKEHPAVAAGLYVRLTVSDSGKGMDAETQARLFEPFFTTKEPGQGTGLGLATVYGIVKQAGGFIWVYSEPGKGTAFKVYLPRVATEEVELAAAEPKPAGPLPGAETILLVEDQAELRKLARRILTRLGYEVLEAANGGEALLHSERHPGPIHLMLTDVVMPGMNGPELADRLKPLRPGMKVLYMSGYTEDAISHRGILDAGVEFISKPVSPNDLALKVREVLGPPSPAGTAPDISGG